MLWASPPAAGADADGRFDVDSVLVTEFLLSFVGTLAGLKLSSDIAACSQRAQRFQSLSAKGVTRGDIGRGSRRSGLVAARMSLGLTGNRSKSYGAAHTQAANRLGLRNETRPVLLRERLIGPLAARTQISLRAPIHRERENPWPQKSARSQTQL